MQNDFLDLTVKKLLGIPGLDWHKCKVIFPNKRPASYFKKALQENVNGDIVFPQIFSIEEFISSYSEWTVTDPVELIFELYKLHLKYKPEESFDTFHNWGNMLLRDYDEMDKYLVDIERFFSHLGATKEIDETNTESDIALEFWSTISRTAPTELQEKFLMHWEIFEKVYSDLNEYLQINKKAYAGMQYREVAGKFQNEEINEDVQNYIFIAFNALSKAEEIIIRTLLKEKKALVYFDTDEYYINDPAEEAGHFIRKSVKNLRLPDPGIVIDKLLKENKEIVITAVPLEASQGMALKEQLQKNPHVGSTAIVLPDEHILGPVMHAMPPDIGKINYTIGKPLTDVSLYSLFELISALQDNFEPSLQSFYYKDVLALLTHPLIVNEENKEIGDFINEIENYELIYVEKNRVRNFVAPAGIDVVFNDATNVPTLILYLERIINLVKEKGRVEESVELIFRELLNKLKGLLLTQDVAVNISTFWRFFRQQAAMIKIPFGDDDPQAIMVMGMLETRALCFDNVYILNVNEGSLPTSRNSHSYIPFDIRKSFGMPTFDEQESLFTYYFYRLLQWAKNIHLFYYTSSGSSGSEASRYIRQLHYFLKKKNSPAVISSDPFSLPLKNHTIKAIKFPKGKHYFDVLKERAAKDGVSPTFISTYYNCSLQFSLKYISRIKPTREISEEMEADKFGTLFHAVMEEFYRELKGKEVIAKDIVDHRKNINSILKKAIEAQHLDSGFYTDKNSLLIESIEVLVNNALNADESYAPFYMLGMEEKLDYTLAFSDELNINLQGKVDRIDSKDGVIRIIDYKTGNVQKFAFDFEDEFEVPAKDNKDAFQAIYYCYLYHKVSGQLNLQPVILPLKKVSEGYQNVNPKQGMMSKQSFDKFESGLKEIINGIFDKTTTISQTEDLKICQICDYKNICIR